MRFLKFLCVSLLFSSAPLDAWAQEDLVDPDPKGYVSGVYGEVRVLEPESSAPRALGDSEPVYEGSRITAGENSFAEISLLDGSEIKIDEVSQLDLAKARADLDALDREVDLSLFYGSVRVSAQDGFSNRSVFRITTPVAVAGVRGTDFAVGYESEDEATVDVYEGEVGVSQDGAEETVDEGEGSTAVRGKGLAKEEIREQRRERWERVHEGLTVGRNENAAERLREKIETVRAENPNDPRLSGLENALENVSKRRADAKERFESAKEKMSDRRQDRLERMREFSKKHAREKFERARAFRGERLTPEQRQSALEKMRSRRSEVRQKATDRHQNRRKELEERRQNRKREMQDKRQDRKQEFQEKHRDKRENIQDRRQNRQEHRQDRKEKGRDRRHR